MERVADGAQIVEGWGDLQDDGFRSTEPSAATLTASGSCPGCPGNPLHYRPSRLAYTSTLTRQVLEDQHLCGCGLREGQANSLAGTKRWVVERTDSRSNAHKKLPWRAEENKSSTSGSPISTRSSWDGLSGKPGITMLVDPSHTDYHLLA